LDRPEVMESVTRLNPKKYIPIILSQYHILSIELFLEKKTEHVVGKLDSLPSYLSIFMRYGYTMIHPWLPSLLHCRPPRSAARMRLSLGATGHELGGNRSVIYLFKENNEKM
jgi:hypothetical protein